MLMIGCDYHPGFQQIAYVDTETGELQERRRAHRQEAEQFYGALRERAVVVRVGREASVFRRSGWRVGRTGIWVSGSGIGTAWCRCVRD